MKKILLKAVRISCLLLRKLKGEDDMVKRIFSYLAYVMMIGVIAGQSACTPVTYVRQNGQSYNDYEAVKHDRVEKVERKKRRSKNKEKFKEYKRRRRN